MKHLKAYEGFFDRFFKKESPPKDKLDREIVKELLESDLDGVKILGNEVLENIIFLKREDNVYKSDKDGNPILRKEKWFDENIEYATPYTSNRDITRSAVVITINHITNMDIRDEFYLILNTYKKINKERMKEYGIGVCLFALERHRYDYILFYAL